MALLDDFNRVADPLGSQWSAFPRPGAGRLAANGSQAYPADVGQTHGDYWNVRDYGPDVEIEITIAALPINATERLELFLRVNNEDDSTLSIGYRLRIAYNGTNFDWTIYKMSSAGGLLALDSGGATVTAGLSVNDRVKFGIVGTTLTASRFTSGSWTTIVTGTDDDYLGTGRIAIAVNGDAWRFDDFNGTDAGPPPPQPIFVGVGVFADSNGGTITPALPSGLITGDLMIVAVGARAVTTALSVPTGWTLIDSDVSDARALMYAYKRYVVGDGAPSITGFGTGNTIIGQVAAWRNIKAVGSPVHVLGSRWRTSGLQNLGPIPGVESPMEGVVIFGAFKGDDWTSVATLTGDGLVWNEIGEPDSTLGSDGGLVWNYALTPTLITPADKTFVVTGGGATAGIGKAFSLLKEDAAVPPAETDNFFHVM